MSMFENCAEIFRSHRTLTGLVQKALDLVGLANSTDDYFEIARLLVAAEHLYGDELIKRVQADPDTYGQFARYLFAEHKPHLLSAAVFSGCSSSRLARFVGPQKEAIIGAIELLSHTNPAARDAAKELLDLVPNSNFSWDPPRPNTFEKAAWKTWWQQKCEAQGPNWDSPSLLSSE